MATASPALGRLTSLPTSMTRPTISWPGTITPVPRPLDETGCRDRRRKAGGCYEELAKRFEADGWIVGRVTMEHVVDGVARTPKAVAGDLREIHVADRKGRNVAVAIDPQGKLHYGKDNVLGDHAIAILGEQVSDEYLSELREDGVSYLFAGKDGHDLRSAVDLLGETFGIKTLLLEGGGMINGAFLKNRLIDEISLLVYPGIDDLKGVASIFDYAGSPDEKPGMGQSLRHIDCRP